VKYTKTLAILALAVAPIAGGYFLWRPDPAPVTPSQWIVDAAVALNRASIHGTAQKMSGAPADGQTAARQLVLEGQRLRVQRRFAEAEAVYREAVKADPMDADAWADLADSAAAAAGNDLTKGRDAILQAIQINPRHRKALWLRASLELQEQHYAQAAATWRELETLVTAGSSDARVIAANIVEADALARNPPASARQGS
jgi:cytochrome c-type biogenesis protein CcmH/NrfG